MAFLASILFSIERKGDMKKKQPSGPNATGVIEVRQAPVGNAGGFEVHYFHSMPSDATVGGSTTAQSLRVSWRV